MPLNKKQVEYIGILSGLPAVQDTYYLSRFRKNNAISTKRDTIKWDDVAGIKRFAEIVPRGTVGKSLTIAGFKRPTITPDMIDAEISVFPEEVNEMNAGELEYVNGAVGKSGQAIKEMKLSVLKNSITNTMELMCGQVYKEGKYLMPKSGDMIDFGIPAPIPVTWNSSTQFLQILFDHVLAFRKLVKRNPTEIAVGSTIFRTLLSDSKFQDAVQKLGGSIARLEGQGIGSTDKNKLILAYIFNTKITAIDPCLDETGTDIMPDNYIYLVDDSSFYPAFAGVAITPVEMARMEMFVDEVEEKRPLGTKLFAYSAFTPLLADPNAIYRLAVTIA